MSKLQHPTVRYDSEKDKPEENKAAGGFRMQMEKKFMEQRKLFLWGEVNDDSMKDVMEKILYLDSDKPGEPIHFYINTPGGSITAGMA
ncbi:MAG: ATP-dependent Clp protease proteolytic subunit, partial [Verrucomicrobiota bacterium]